MENCLTCSNWKQKSFYNHENCVNIGECNVLLYELEIELKTGWDGGYVKAIETNHTFGCVLHNLK